MKRLALPALALALISCGRGEEAANRAATAPVASDQRAQPANQASPPLQTGLWEISVEVLKRLGDTIKTSEGSYAVTGLVHSPPKQSECMTSDRAANPFQKFWFMTGYVDGKNCNYDKFAMHDGKIHGTIDCRKSGQGSEFSLDGQVHADKLQCRHSRRATGHGARD